MLWLIVTVLSCYVFVATIEILGGGATTPTWYAACCALVLFVFWKSRRDGYATAGYLMVVSGLSVAMGTAFGASGEYDVGYDVAAVALLVFLLASAHMLWRERGPDPFRNVLREAFHRRHIEELDGVQLVVVHPAEEVLAGGLAAVEIHAQNGFDMPRTLCVSLVPERRFSRNRAGLDIQPEARLTLPGGAAGVLTIPIAVAPAARGKHTCMVRVVIDGEGGNRVRRWRTRTFENPPNVALGLLGLFAGSLAIATQGARIAVRVKPGAAAAETANLEPVQEITWRPSATELATAAAR